MKTDREALVGAIRQSCAGWGWLPNELPDSIADDLLAAGWRGPGRAAQPDDAIWPARLWIEHNGYPNGPLHDGDGEVYLADPGGGKPVAEYALVREIEEPSDAA